MASLRFLDSFDHYGANNNGTKYPDLTGFNINSGENTNYTISSIYGRNGQGLRISTGGHVFDGQTNLTRLSADGPHSIWAFGFAFKITDRPPKNSVPIFSLIDTSTVRTAVGLYYGTQISAYLTKAQGIYVASGEPEGTVLISNSRPLRRNTWHFIEVSVTISSAGSATLKIDGELIGSFSGDTRGLASSTADGFRIGYGKMWNYVESSLGQRFFCLDDIYLTDGNFLGDIANKAIRPIVDGSVNQWSPTPAASNYTNVDDDTPDNDNTYIFAPSISLNNVFSMVDISTTTNVSIPALQVVGVGRAGFDNPNVAATGIVRIGGVTYSGVSTALGTPNQHIGYFNSGVTYDHRTEVYPFTTNPSSGGTWSPSTISLSEFGVTRTL